MPLTFLYFRTDHLVVTEDPCEVFFAFFLWRWNYIWFLCFANSNQCMWFLFFLQSDSFLFWSQCVSVLRTFHQLLSSTVGDWHSLSFLKDECMGVRDSAIFLNSLNSYWAVLVQKIKDSDTEAHFLWAVSSVILKRE